MSSPSVYAHLCMLNPDDLLTELARCCAVPRWVFMMRDALTTTAQARSDQELFQLAKQTWQNLSAQEQLFALQQIPPLSLSEACWQDILSPSHLHTDLVQDLIKLSVKYQVKTGFYIPVALFKGDTLAQAIQGLEQRLERSHTQELTALKEFLIEQVCRELEAFKIREEQSYLPS